MGELRGEGLPWVLGERNRGVRGGGLAKCLKQFVTKGKISRDTQYTRKGVVCVYVHYTGTPDTQLYTDINIPTLCNHTIS